MILKLGKIESFPAKLSLESSGSELEPDFEGLLSISAVQAELTIQEGNEEYFCQGKVCATVMLECARCLKSFDKAVESPVDFIICADEYRKEISGKANDSEDYAPLKSSDMTSDISTVIRQAILLSVSMKPVCSEDCKGLCDKCGKSLNTGDCKCKNERTDPRWDGLKKLTINNKH